MSVGPQQTETGGGTPGSDLPPWHPGEPVLGAKSLPLASGLRTGIHASPVAVPLTGPRAGALMAPASPALCPWVCRGDHWAGHQGPRGRVGEKGVVGRPPMWQ